ncbi:Kinesin heavy chain [Mycena sanguinolenta]|uniref:Kinesin heavy chain n=1 Tax=Mycena sanguinolenta TaxID=230812 RepID=A0A8H6YRF3_9AGAR|nr:Kinesin heavy chain [Mycena sanguinolenta]
MATNIKVVCRFRPLNATELKEGPEIVASFSDDFTTVQMRSQALALGPEKDGFTFDRVFPMATKQTEVFDYGVKDIVKDVLDGYNGTVFAYGQTGSGKTFTMMGDIESEEYRGIIPRITEQIFQSIVESDAHLEYLVKVSYMEIYLEKIRDLLAPQNDNLQVHEEKTRGVYIKGLSDYYVSSAREVYEIMRTGGNARVVSHTNMNAESSRSHSIFLISINQRNTETGAQKTGNLYLVDLAGSEKVGKTGASGQTLEEAKKINKSLSALGMVINALTDSKIKYIPYRDSKLTRILQESLGGNSRTTLIINCSPSSYNEIETVSTLPLRHPRQGLLAKAQAANTTYQKHIAALEAELAIWRSGGHVAESDWAKVGSGASAAAAPKKEAPPASPASAGPTTPVATSRSLTPVHPGIEGLRTEELQFSRPQTPVSIALEKDEREDFLRRENELSDALAEKETALATAEKLVKELREELAFLKEQEAGVNKENKAMSTQLNELRLQVERLNYDNKEGSITIDILKEQNADALAELEDVRKQIAELKIAQKDASAEDKEKRKQEKMAMMMAKFDTQGAFSEKDEQLRAILGKLDSIDSVGALSQEDLTAVRRQLSEGQNMIRETVDRLRQSQEENEMITRRRDELESRVAALETEYEELLEKTIHDEETSNVDLAESMADLKNKLEAQYAARRDAHISEVADLKQQLELRNNEVRSLNASAESLKSVNEELKRAFAVTSAGIEGGKNLAESAQDLERTRKAIHVQLAEFDGVKKSLMRDLQNRCEKVVELEIQLDEIKEQYNNVIRNSNSKAQQKKMAFLERNLEQLTLVQKQLVDQNSTLKKEAGIAERKLLARNERIQNLEALLQDADRRLSLQNQKFEAQLQAVKERLDQARAQKTASSSPLNFGRIAKPLRGGGGMGAPASIPTPISGGGGSANPLTRIQNEDGGGGVYFNRILCCVDEPFSQTRVMVFQLAVRGTPIYFCFYICSRIPDCILSHSTTYYDFNAILMNLGSIWARVMQQEILRMEDSLFTFV